MDSEYRTVPLEDLRASKTNPRKHFDRNLLEELAKSIAASGVLEPLLVRPINGAGTLEVVAGARRLLAAKKAGLTEVPVRVMELTDLQVLETQIIENIQREGVHPLDEAEGYRALIQNGYTVERIAERVGRSEPYVYERMKLLELADEAQELFFDGKIELGHAHLLSRLTPPDQIRAIAVGLFEEEPQLGFEEGEKRPVRLVSVHAFSDWIGSNVRLDPVSAPDLFPEAAAVIADSEEKAERVVLITRDVRLPEALRGEPILVRHNWKRADGRLDEPYTYDYGEKRKKSKTCEVSVFGVVVLGYGRGETFRVCTDKFCETHFGAEQRERAKRTTGTATEKAREEAQREREEAARATWTAAAPKLLEALTAAVSTCPDLPAIESIVLDYCLEPLAGPDLLAFKATTVKGDSLAEVCLKRAALAIICGYVFDDYRGPLNIPELAKPLGVDVAKILKEHAPRPTKKKAS